MVEIAATLFVVLIAGQILWVLGFLIACAFAGIGEAIDDAFTRRGHAESRRRQAEQEEAKAAYNAAHGVEDRAAMAPFREATRQAFLAAAATGKDNRQWLHNFWCSEAASHCRAADARLAEAKRSRLITMGVKPPMVEAMLREDLAA